MEDIHSESDGSQRPIIVFDAMCVLCSANAQFVLSNDRRGHFLLASMQGEVGSSIYRKFGIDPTAPDTIVVVTGEHALRDPAYRFIARNRYHFRPPTVVARETSEDGQHLFDVDIGLPIIGRLVAYHGSLSL